MIRTINISIGLFLITFALFFTTNFAEKSYKKYSLTYVSEHKPNEGKYKEYYDDGSLYSVEYYQNGQKTGIWRYYYKNGLLKTRLRYKEGLLDGDLWHFGQNGDLIFREKYTQDSLVKKEIINDSLYRYEIVFESHGMKMFNQSCTPCHNSNEVQSLHFGVNDLQLFVDSSGVARISLDSIHLLNADSIDIGIATGVNQIGPVDNPKLHKYDLEAIIHYIEKQQSHQKKKARRIRKIKVRKKTVYLPFERDMITEEPFTE